MWRRAINSASEYASIAPSFAERQSSSDGSRRYGAEPRLTFIRVAGLVK